MRGGILMGGLIRQGIFRGAMQRCSVRITYCMVHIPPHAPISRTGLKVVSLAACPSDTAHMIHIQSVGLEMAEACSAKFFLEQ